jgi:exo-beta-1,3-glucanase (GH17 family)
MSRPAPLLLPLLLVLAALVVAAWWWPNRPQAGDVTMPDTVFNAVSFAPFRPGQSPFSETFPTQAQVAEDVALLAGKVRAIRSYAALGGKADLAALAWRHGLKLWQGVWLGNDRAKNAQEIAAAIALANRYPDTIDRVIVGNEVLLRRDLPVEELIADIDIVRRAVKQPVTYADVWDFWRQFPQVAPHVDIVTIHLLPYWEDVPTGIDGAVREVGNAYRQIAAMFPGKPIAIGETGWPSRGRWRRDAAPSRVNQMVFLRRFIALSRQEGFEYNLIEAFDQDWKYRSEGTVGANWGLWTDDRRPKFPLSGPMEEDPGWRGNAAVSVVLGLVLLGGVLWSPEGFTRRTPRAPRSRHGDGKPTLRAKRMHSSSVPSLWRSWCSPCEPPLGWACLPLAVLAMALGWALVWAWVGTVPVVYDAQLAVAAAVNLTGQAALALLLLDRAALVLAGHPLAPHRTGADATETVLGLFRLRLPRLPLRAWLLDDLSFVFIWTAAMMQLLLLFDPRYRDFPLPVFIVPLLATLARTLLGDLPRGGGREELWAGGTLAVAAVASAVNEGPLNLQSLTWNVAAVVLAAPMLLSAMRPVRVRVPA